MHVLASDPLRWSDLGLRPGIDLGPLTLRFYALAYILGILLGYWHLLRMVRAPGSPLTREQVDDLVLWATIGIVVGGRVGYATFYDRELWRTGEILEVWHGGMSFHGGLAGVLVAIGLVARRHGLPLLRVGDYAAVNVPFGMMLGRIANFINGELWGRPVESDVPWAMVFPGADNMPRHPSQLYEALLEGLALFVVLALLIRAGALKRPGLVTGAFMLGYGMARSVCELFREPDPQLGFLWGGLTMGMLLCIPMMLAGAGFVAYALRHRQVPAP